MKIYFAGSITGGRGDKDLYAKLIEHLTQYGKVLTEHVGDVSMGELGENNPDDEWIFSRDVSWIEESDVLIAEVTTPSLGVGYEVAKAESMGKDILCLYRDRPGKRLSAMINGNPKLKVRKYSSTKEAFECISDFFKSGN